ncbi:MAG: enoyl-CoA hydratase [Dehalococcoidia bacterium]|nr:enoyl-CoA hydratase [Dehalococcoidia bacterium]
MSYEGLTLDKEAGVATLTLNRPEQLNAISLPMIKSIGKAIDDVHHDDGVKVLIITGAGRAFCAGLDIAAFKEVEEMSPQELSDDMRSLALPLYNLPKPAIAAINGITTGAGLSIAMLCDIRIASEKARFSSAYIRMGMVPDAGATYFLPRIVGTAKAIELMVTGDSFDAAEAKGMGLLNKVVPEGEVMKVARELAGRIASGPSVAIKLIKQAAYQGIRNSLEQQIEFECIADYICLRTEDHKEGVKAFFEKRPPQFKGR